MLYIIIERDFRYFNCSKILKKIVLYISEDIISYCHTRLSCILLLNDIYFTFIPYCHIVEGYIVKFYISPSFYICIYVL